MNSQKKLSNSALRMLLKFAVVTCFSVFSLLSVAADTAAENVRLTVEASVNSLVARLEEKRPLYKENTEEFYREMGAPSPSWLTSGELRLVLWVSTVARRPQNNGIALWKHSSAAFYYLFKGTCRKWEVYRASATSEHAKSRAG